MVKDFSNRHIKFVFHICLILGVFGLGITASAQNAKSAVGDASRSEVARNSPSKSSSKAKTQLYSDYFPQAEEGAWLLEIGGSTPTVSYIQIFV